MSSAHLKPIPPSAGGAHTRLWRGNPTGGELRDPFTPRPVWRAFLAMSATGLAMLVAWWLHRSSDTVTFAMTAGIGITTWVICLAVLLLCTVEATIHQLRSRIHPRLDELQLDPRLIRLLQRHGFTTIEEVERCPDQLLLLIPNLDDKGLLAIRRAIHLRGYLHWQEAGFPVRPS